MARQSPRHSIAQVTYLHPDARNGILWCASVTLGSTGQVTSFTLPDDAVGFRLRPTTTDVYFAVNENPPASLTAITSASSAGVTTAVATTFGIGGVAKADAWEARLLEDCGKIGADRTLRLRPATGASVCVVEVF